MSVADGRTDGHSTPAVTRASAQRGAKAKITLQALTSDAIECTKTL